MLAWHRFPLTDGGAPKAAERCGLAGRYRFWIGESGRRYLCTAVPAHEIGDFDDAIVVIARGEGGGGYVGCDVIDLGAAGDPSADDVARQIVGNPGLTAFVHLLAIDAGERGGIAADLLGTDKALAA